MSCSSTRWSPNSFQLRLASRCRKSPTVFVRMRFQKLDRWIRLFSVAGDSAMNVNGMERRRNGNSLVSSGSSADALDGGSGAEGGKQSNESQLKQSLGGIMGAGVAGVLLVVGITFAACSIGKQSTSRQKHQMEALTTQQEIALAFDDGGDRVEEKKIEGKNEMQDVSTLESEAIIDEHPSNKENYEATIENRFSNDTDAENISNSDDVTNNVSIQQEDLKSELPIDDMPVAPEATQELLELQKGAAPFVAQSFENSNESLVAVNSELITEVEENPIDVKAMNLVFDANQTNLSGDLQEEVSALAENETSSTALDSFSNHNVHGPCETLASDIIAKSQSDVVLGPLTEPGEDSETANSLSTSDHDLSKTSEVPAKENKPSLDVYNLSRDTSSGTVSMSTLADSFTLGQDNSSYNDNNGTQSISDSINPENRLFSAGIPAPSVVSADRPAHPGKILVPAAVDQVQGQALAALQVLKVIEADAQPGDLCTRREYARWLVSASNALARNTSSKVYPSMYIENVTELAFDDITTEDPDYTNIQGLAEAGLISSKLSRYDKYASSDGNTSPLYFSPERPLSRQDLVSWKMALEKRQLPVVDRKTLQQLSGFIDIDRINQDAWPAVMADLSAGEWGIIALAFGNTRLFQPHKPVTKAEAAIALATGEASDIVSEELARIETESMAEKAVSAYNALVAQVEKDVNASFEKELSLEREKIDAVEKLAEAAMRELERLRAEREEENIALVKKQAAVNSEMEVLSKLRHDVNEQLQTVVSGQVEISYEKERLSRLQKDAEIENQEISRLHYELEVERKALSMARAWAEDEAKRAREQARDVEEARDRWEKHNIKVVVDKDLPEEANAGVTSFSLRKDFSIEGTVSRAGNLVDNLKLMAADIIGKSRDTIHKVIQKILFLISKFKEWFLEAGRQTGELRDTTRSRFGVTLQELQQSSAGYSSSIKELGKRIAGDFREGVEKLSQKFKT